MGGFVPERRHDWEAVAAKFVLIGRRRGPQSPVRHASSMALSAATPDRLDTLAAHAILDTPPEAGFDDVVRLTCRLCEVPVALVSLVAADRQWFKARVGFPQCETDLGSSVCKFVLTERDMLVIPDLAADPRTATNPLVTGEPFRSLS